MTGTFWPPPLVCDPDMHHGTCVMHVPWCMPGSLTSGFLWSQWRGKRSWHSRHMHNPQFYISGKRPIEICVLYNASIDSCYTMQFCYGEVNFLHNTQNKHQLYQARGSDMGRLLYFWQYLKLCYNNTELCWGYPILSGNCSIKLMHLRHKQEPFETATYACGLCIKECLDRCTAPYHDISCLKVDI